MPMHSFESQATQKCSFITQGLTRETEGHLPSPRRRVLGLIAPAHQSSGLNLEEFCELVVKDSQY